MNLFEQNIANSPTVEVTQATLHTIWGKYMPNKDYATMEAAQVFEKAFLQYAGEDQEKTDLAFLQGGWTFKLKAGLVKTALSGAFMAGMFCWIGFESVSAAVLPSVLPFLFELEKIELSQKEETLLAKLLVREEVKQKLHSTTELYQMLPAATRKMINELDFQDFLEKLDMAGHLKEKTDGQYQLSEKLRFKISFI